MVLREREFVPGGGREVADMELLQGKGVRHGVAELTTGIQKAR